MIWKLTLTLGGEEEVHSLSGPEEIIAVICDELAIPHLRDAEEMKDRVGAFALYIDVEVMADGQSHFQTVSIYDVVDAMCSNHAYLSLEARLRQSV